MPGIGVAGAAWTAEGGAADGDVGWFTLVCATALAATSVKPKPAINERAEVYVMV
jgi:hypothetical protein